MKQILTMLLVTGLLLSAPAPGMAQEETRDASTVARVPGLLRGTVTDASGDGLSEVAVKLFEEGFLLAETRSGAGGAYELEFEYSPELDWTMVAWYVPPIRDLICEIVILRESFRSREMGLWSPCLPRSELRSVIRQDIRLLDENDKLAQMSELDCLEE